MIAAKLFKRVNVYGVLFVLFAGGIAALLGFASILLVLDMVGISIF
ncbi:MAG: hypothetical protein QF774_02325 [Nitrospinota bacterium]|jgi:hypothetical protein|nr:hypothetical protein [Nitrospinota bacterium]